MEPFAIVLFVVVAVALVVGLLTLAGRAELYERIGRGGLALDREEAAATAAAAREPSLEDEVRQLVEARNARRLRAGEPPLDVDAEVARQLRELSGG